MGTLFLYTVWSLVKTAIFSRFIFFMLLPPAKWNYLAFLRRESIWLLCRVSPSRLWETEYLPTFFERQPTEQLGVWKWGISFFYIQILCQCFYWSYLRRLRTFDVKAERIMFSKTHYELFKLGKISISHKNISQGIFLFCRIDIFKLTVDVSLSK